jgi:hypothetical protein
MKKLLLLLGSAISLPSLVGGVVAETVVVSSSDILTGKAPLACEVQRRKDGSIALVLRVNESTEVKGLFLDYDLRVLKTPSEPSAIREKVLSAEQLAWHRSASQSPMVFVVTEKEVPLAYIVGRWSLGDAPNGVSRVKQVCFSVQDLVEASQKDPTRR